VKRISILSILLFLILGSIMTFAQTAAKPAFVGTWKLNVAKSKYSPGPTPKTQTAVIDSVDGGMKVVSDRVEADGKTVHFEWTAKFDGKDYALVGDPTADTRAYRKQGARTLLMTVKKAGKVTINGRIVVTANGKSRTVTTTGTDAKGKRIKTIAVYDKA